jgi:hypothetical protein
MGSESRYSTRDAKRRPRWLSLIRADTTELFLFLGKLFSGYEAV